MAPSHPPSCNTEELTRAFMAGWAEVYGGPIFCSPEALSDDLPLSRLLTFFGEVASTAGPAAEESGRGSIPPPEVSPEIIAAFIAAVHVGELVTRHTTSYLAVFRRSGVAPEEVGDYLRAERAVIADIDLEARTSAPSREQLRHSAIRLAIDPRRPVSPELYALNLHEGRPFVNRFTRPRKERSTAAAPEESIRLFTLPAAAVLREVLAPDFDRLRLANLTEQLFGRQVKATDGTTTAKSSDRVVEFLLAGDRVRVWVHHQELHGVDGTDCRAVLRYFCTAPGRTATGPQLRSVTGVTNPGRGVKDLIEALTAVRATDWFRTRPYGWADGVIVTPRLAG